MNTKYQSKGFTLLELLIVIGIIAVISSITILVINPSEYFKRGRDTRRISDLNNLHFAMSEYYTSGVANFDLDGPNYTGSCASPGKVFISTPSGVAGPANLPSGWTYASTTSANLRKTDGSGWMPVNLNSIPAGSPLNTLPVDPVNDINQAFYYTYVCSTSSPVGYELNANLESRQFNKGGRDDRTSKDGGDDPNVYEAGSRLTINPMAPIGYWAMDGGTSGSIPNNTTAGFEDSSNYSNHGTAKNANGTGMAWTTGKVGGAVNFDSVDDYVLTPDYLTIPNNFGGTTGKVTVSAWINSAQHTSFANITFRVGPFHYFSVRNDNRRLGCMTWQASAANYWPISNSSIPLDTWKYVTFVLNGGVGYQFYIDGVLDANVSYPDIRLYDYGDSGGIGLGYDAATYFKGTIDEPRIYNRVLSAAEISHYYNISR